MNHKRVYKTFVHKEAVFRICCEQFETVVSEIRRQRKILEDYIAGHVEFQTSLVPIELKADAPESAKRMESASRLVGTGPMAAVAGAMAQLAAEAAIKKQCSEVIVENGGTSICKHPNLLSSVFTRASSRRPEGWRLVCKGKIRLCQSAHLPGKWGTL